ncbi:hypothetical protein Q9233_011935 [Columba guinea]|nr:hypothetical protein Q9233_011935 [Columba guinea]
MGKGRAAKCCRWKPFVHIADFNDSVCCHWQVKDGMKKWANSDKALRPVKEEEWKGAPAVAALAGEGWIFGAHSPVIGFSPSSSVEFVPVFPPVYTSTVLPHAGKNWMDKRLPSCKIYLNNTFALDSAWVHPEDSRLFQGNEKPLLLTNQVAMAIARPAAASRPLPTMVLAPQLVPGGCQHSLKAVGGSQALALATTALVSVEPEATQGPAGQPCHLLTFRPIKIPLLPAPLPGDHIHWAAWDWEAVVALERQKDNILSLCAVGRSTVVHVSSVSTRVASQVASEVQEESFDSVPIKLHRETCVDFTGGLLRIIGGISDSSAGIDGSSVFLVSRELINVNSFARGFDRSRKKKLSLPEVPTSAQAGKCFSVLLEMVKLRAPPVMLLRCGEHNKHHTDLFLFRSASRLDAHVGPLMPTQVTRVTAVSPAVTLMAANLMDQTLTDNGKESSRPSCPPTLILHAERKSSPAESDGDKDHSFKLVNEDDSTSNGSKPVASTPVPGSPWCVVWTGDDRVFFFNPTMQLSVWEKPLDLKHRGDINRLIEDPPHKRKLEPAATDKCLSSCPREENDDFSIKTKRNKTEDPQAADQGKAETEEKSKEPSAPQVTPPLEERITHFRDMLLERGVSAFSTWEKELHKIVFDPRYLLLNSEERKQIFEQFVKTRIREEYKEKKNKLLLAKEEFKKLLEESKLSPRTTFKEFAEKYGRDQRFRLVQKKKDQEHFFNQFILILKKRDKENRIRLRKMR